MSYQNGPFEKGTCDIFEVVYDKKINFREMMPYMDGYGKESYDIFTKRVANDILSFSSHRAQLVVFKPSMESRYNILYIYIHIFHVHFSGGELLVLTNVANTKGLIKLRCRDLN